MVQCGSARRAAARQEKKKKQNLGLSPASAISKKDHEQVKPKPESAGSMPVSSPIANKAGKRGERKRKAIARQLSEAQAARKSEERNKRKAQYDAESSPSAPKKLKLTKTQKKRMRRHAAVRTHTRDAHARRSVNAGRDATRHDATRRHAHPIPPRRAAARATQHSATQGNTDNAAQRTATQRNSARLNSAQCAPASARTHAGSCSRDRKKTWVQGRRARRPKRRR